jgi:glucose-6-phosphate 1-dehydrogenase
VTTKRIALINSLVPDHGKLVLGQYQGYHDEVDVQADSKTNTFFALRTMVQNQRLAGVPIYIRAGKQLPLTATEISFVFKTSSKRLFAGTKQGHLPNVLVYRIQPNEGIILRILTKTPGDWKSMDSTYMQFCYKHITSMLPDAYELLLMDAIEGDQTFFIDAPEVEAQWQFIDHLKSEDSSVHVYQKGSWGPQAAADLIRADGREWIEPSTLFCAL